MLRRLSPGLIFALACAAAFAACSSYGSSGYTPSSGGVTGQGPNFVTNTLYVTNTTQSVIEIYTPSPSAAATPQYAIGGSNTSLNGPLYEAFDSAKHLYVTNYNPGTQAASVNIYAQFATGSVLPFGFVSGAASLLGQPHGIALESDGTIVVANTATSGAFTSDILIFSPLTTSTVPFLTFIIGGNATQLNNPNGVAIDSSKNIFVTNRGSGTITAYPLPTATPVPSSTPTTAPTTNPSASPSPTPTPFSSNVTPSVLIGGAATGLIAPTGIALDSTNVIYVADPDNGNASIRIFAAGSNGNVAPTRVIAGALTLLSNPIDVKLDATGNIYVADAGANKLLIFAPGANGNVAPAVAIALPAGSVTGLVLSP